MLVDQARGGTNRSGVPASAFVMQPGRRIRYDVADPALAACVSGYAIYMDDHRAPMVNWYLPAPPMITILLDAGPLRVSFRHRDFIDVDRAAVWGPIGHAYRTMTEGGISVGIGLTAQGWARFTAQAADGWRDQVVPLSTFVGADAAAGLVAALDALDDDAAIAPLLDRLLPRFFTGDHAAADLTAGLGRLVLTDGVIGVEDVADRLGIDLRTLRRLATRWFGMPPKTLLTRARFVRSFAGWLMAGEPTSYAGIDSSYFDTAHFLLDARRYLGTTPRRFAQFDTDYLRASLRARAAVLGAPTHVLHGAG